MLTEREKEILELLNAGNNYRDIARHLNISRHTVKALICFIKRKKANKSSY